MFILNGLASRQIFGIEWNLSAPKRQTHASYFFPFSLFSFKAQNTFSGFAGRSLIHTPVASWMALMIAGGAEHVLPSLASFAPNGPNGSLVITWITLVMGAS